MDELEKKPETPQEPAARRPEKKTILITGAS